ncbi:hypothetical protein KSC_007120 [Ktedonobacter sp. SOSP1-52]|nr:hypothetical protein [Ktedonobacter sp. SOSP1-52]GHO61820.1 hypothetical protein KSC_007120 [Ktedonobacter sp. SOSP1-52]
MERGQHHFFWGLCYAICGYQFRFVQPQQIDTYQFLLPHLQRGQALQAQIPQSLILLRLCSIHWSHPDITAHFLPQFGQEPLQMDMRGLHGGPLKQNRGQNNKENEMEEIERFGHTCQQWEGG